MTTNPSLPPHVGDFDTQEQRCVQQLAACTSGLQKFNYLGGLRISQVHQFYRLVIKHFTQMAPFIYTPVVGEACLRWSEIYRQPEGMYLSYDRDRHRLSQLLQSWPQDKVAITVITDGSRILGLGDLGVNGMGIPIGKLSLYVACAGIDPAQVLPITVDLGTNNKELLASNLYMGSRRSKNSHEEEEAFLDELMEALTLRWPGIVIQFEDWKNPWYTLEKYRSHYTMFNDDIQGTGAVIMGGMISAIALSGRPLKEHRAVFFGSGSAAVGVAKQIVQYFIREGLSEDEARSRFWLVDRHGLVTLDRGDDLPEHKQYFARSDNNGQQCANLDETAEYVKPSILVGLSGLQGAFSKSLLQKMTTWSHAPIVFPLSNPVTHAECTYEDAIVATEGRVLFAAGSPFDHMVYHGGDYHPAQGNNMYVFPGIGLGAILSEATEITDAMIYASGATLPEMLMSEKRATGMLYPSLDRIREVSCHVALSVIRAAQKDNVDRATKLRDMSDDDLMKWIQEKMYDPCEMKDPEQQ